MADALTVVKVGGSLFDLADLGPRLHAWLQGQGRVLLVPGGGLTADLVRAWDRRHRLGEEAAHWLALRTLSLNAHLLATLLPDAAVVGSIDESMTAAGTPILDMYPFALADEGRPGCLPHTWAVTSDSLAARVAVVAGARRLVLLKSVDVLVNGDWNEAARRGWVDAHFEKTLAGGNLEVTAVNLRRKRT